MTGAGSMLTALKEKLSKLLSGDDTKAIQKIVLALGHMSATESSTTHVDAALDLVFSLSRSKVVHNGIFLTSMFSH